MRVKLRRSGNTFRITWPYKLAKRMKLESGDELDLVETERGVLVTRHNASFEKTMKVALKVMKEHDDVLKELARY